MKLKSRVRHSTSTTARAARDLASAAVIAAVLLAVPAGAQPSAPEVPDPIPVEGFEQLIAPGVIAALFDPTFVDAEEADTPDDAWVLGFAHGGEAYAYDLNLLNGHEIVNHTAGDAAIAAVW